MELVDREASTERAMEALHWCVTMGHIDILQALLKTHFTHSKLSSLSDQCNNILSAAAQTGTSDALLNLLPYVDDMYLRRTDDTTKRNKITKLLCAVAPNGDENVVAVLLEKGGDPNALYKGKPLLHIALTLGHMKIAQMLVEHGADLQLRDQKGDCVLTSAICANIENKEAIIHWLIKQGSDTEVKGVSGKQPIHLAAAHFPPAIEELVEAGCDVNIRDDINNDTPLHIACSCACSSSVFSLIHFGANMNPVNNMGETPLSKLLKLAKDPHNFHSKSRIRLAQILVKCGFRMYSRSHICKPGTGNRRGRDKVADAYRRVQQGCTEVTSLLHLSRLRVRESISGIRFCKQLEQLDIPPHLRYYLAFENELSFV